MGTVGRRDGKIFIGRKDEMRMLQGCIDSRDSHFLVVYGRRRVGKTFLIDSFFDDEYCFSYTGYYDISNEEQLERFNEKLTKYGGREVPVAENWFKAFDQLQRLIDDSPFSGKKVIFLDEISWMDAHRSRFLSALEGFWNGWASKRDDILLIVCGSATSWITKKLLRSKGGLHNRVTRRIFVKPFTLRECEEFLKAKEFSYTRKNIAECYMVFGGIPFYLGLLARSLSPTQNINELCFREEGALVDEYRSLYYSLFDAPERYMAVVEALTSKTKGLSRYEIADITKIPSGGMLKETLEDLERCGFIRKYREYNKQNKNAVFQLIDPFTLFYHKKMVGRVGVDEDYWVNSLQSGGRNAWSGLAFEILCLWHIPQIKARLGISGVSTEVFAWRGKSPSGAQVDLVIDRKDGIINLCEEKNTALPFDVSRKYAEYLDERKAIFKAATKTKKAVHTTLISASGLSSGGYQTSIDSLVSLDDLFQ
jgi:AAA+ ATPase superfamily predicted ATPase